MTQLSLYIIEVKSFRDDESFNVADFALGAADRLFRNAPITANPHPHHGMERESWAAGWRDADTRITKGAAL